MILRKSKTKMTNDKNDKNDIFSGYLLEKSTACFFACFFWRIIWKRIEFFVRFVASKKKNEICGLPEQQKLSAREAPVS